MEIILNAWFAEKDIQEWIFKQNVIESNFIWRQFSIFHFLSKQLKESYLLTYPYLLKG